MTTPHLFHPCTTPASCRALPRVFLGTLLALLVASGYHPAFATTHAVTSTADSGTGSLREAISFSVSGDSINFAVAGPIVLTSGELDIGRNLTITGPAEGVTVERSTAAGTSNFRIFNIAAGTVVFSNLTIANGSPAGTSGSQGAPGTPNGGPGGPGMGGGILNEGSLRLVNCTVSGNTASGGAGGSSYEGAQDGSGGDGSGGGIYNGGSLTVVNTAIVNNMAAGGAGGFSGIGGAFGGNAGNGNGGGIFNGGMLSLANSTTNGNRATGGSYVPGDVGVIGVGGAGGNGSGGGIYDIGTITIANCTVSGNTTTGGNGQPGNYSCGNGGNGDGGGVYIASGSSTSALNVIVAGNMVAPGAGGTFPPKNLAGSPGTAAGPDLEGAVQSQGHNLIAVADGSSGWTSTDFTGSQAVPLGAGLDPAGPENHGGSVVTIALVPGSPAIDTGSDAVLSSPDNLTTDARGFPRKLGAHVDIGAFEYDPLQTGPTLVVNTLADHIDDGAGQLDCTLREAIDAVNGSTNYTTITFKTGLTGTILLTRGALTVTRNLTLTGPGARLLTVDGDGNDSVFNLSNSSGATSITISGFTITDGSAGDGGGILTNVNLTLTACTFAQNTASNAGGAIYSSAASLTVTGCTFNLNSVVGSASGAGGAVAVIGSPVGANITNCTFTGNSAPVGGALYVGSSGNSATATLESCTVSGNSANIAGGISNGGGATITLKNTIVAGNTASQAGPDLYSAFTSGGYNFIGQSDGSTGFTNGTNGDQVGTSMSPLDSRLDALKNNGGPTDTMALLTGSPCIDKGKSFGLTTDQLGFKRPADFPNIPNASGGDGADIGAFELQLPLAAPTNLKATAGNASVSLTWTAVSGATSYHVKRSTTAGGPYSTIASPTTNSYTNTGLTNGTTYFYVVTAVNSSGESGNSNQASAIPTAGTSNTFQSVDVTVATDNSARLLWGKSDGTEKLTSYANNGASTPGTTYGPNAGWTAKAVAAGTDSLTRILWTESNGTAAIWLMNLNNTSSKGFTIGTGPGAGWTAADVTVGSDKVTRVLWTAANGSARLDSVSNTGTVTAGTKYGPNSGWTAVRVAAGSDGLTRILWTESNGTAAIWLMALNNTESKGLVIGTGPGSGWTAVDVTIGSDNQARVLWTKSGGYARVDSISNTGMVTTGKQYGPETGWTAKGLAAGSDGITRIYWVNTSGTAAIWLLNAANTQTGGFTCPTPSS